MMPHANEAARVKGAREEREDFEHEHDLHVHIYFFINSG